MKIKNYKTNKNNDSRFLLRSTTFVFLLGAIMLTNFKLSAQNNALHFDGIDDSVEIPASINDQITGNNITLEGWFNIESIGDQVELIGERYDSGLADEDVKFTIYYSLGDNSIYASFGQGANFPAAIAPIPALNTWVHIAGTYDGAFLRLYYNGVQVAEQAETGSLPASTGPWVLGKRTDASGFFGGKMDEVRIWNTTRNAAEILANYKNQVLDNSAGLIAYYKMNQGVAEGNNTGVSSLTDSTTFALNGTLNGPFALTGSTSNFVTGMPTVWNSSWSLGTPDATTDAVIEGNYSVAGNFAAKTLTVNNGAVVTIPSGTNVTVTDALTVTAPATFTLSNNANLIQVSNIANTGTITVNRVSNSLKRFDYTLWSSPVANQNLLAFSPLTSVVVSPPSSRFYNYDSTVNLYSTITDPANTTFTTGTGYLIRMPNEDPANLGISSDYYLGTGTPTITYNGVFTGTPNNGNVSVTGLSFNSYNAIGNPYPSTIDAQLFLDGNSTDGVLYFWRKTNAASGTAYATFTSGGATTTTPSSLAPDGTIAVGQGFIVKTGVAATTLNFTNAMRTSNNSAQFFKTKKVVQKDRVWLNLTNTKGVFSQALVAYITDASQGVDKYDGKYINDSPIALTSNINNKEYTIQGRPAFDVSDIVALNFKTDVAGDYSIAIDHTDGLFATGQDVYLVDSKTGTETNLKTSGYTFTSAAGVDNTRFSLKYQKTLKVDAPVFNDNTVRVYKNNGALYVNSGAVAIANIKVFDIQGRLISEQKGVKSNTATISNLKATQQVLIVQVTSEDKKVVNKKVVN
jgi:hypothetical protein